MNHRTFDPALISKFCHQLQQREKSNATLEKYKRDLRFFSRFLGEKQPDKAQIVRYKQYLQTHYAPASVNSMLSSLNAFLRFCGKADWCTKQLKLQKSAFCPEEKELSKTEYHALVQAAEKKKKQRLALVLQTICATGIRVSELESISIEAAQQGKATVSCKGKTRTVFLVPALCKKLLRYAKAKGIIRGKIFITRSGKPLDRSNIWQEMKSLCKEAGVSPGKVFPHNLRHLFARLFYGIEKDIAGLADLLGHSNINTTRIYIISTGAEHRRKVESMHLIL